MKECPACHRCFQDHLNHCPSDGDKLNFLINLDTTLDERYLLERKLGQGGMGLVFKAHHKFIKTQHAIKVILPDLVGNDPSLVARFRQEAMAAAAIRHPNTVSVTDYGILNGTTPYLVMEFVEGRSLHEILSEQKRLAPETAVEIMLAVCAGVAAAHRQGIVHRDLKPLNIMLQPGVPPGESLKVLDFGLAKIKSGELLGSFVAAQTQGMMGSPFYMAPEQWHDEDIDARSDIYSLGVILYQMIAGDVPFKGKSVPSIMQMHLNTPPVPLSERGIEVEPALEQAVRHALEKDPAQRPASVEEFAAELRAALPQLNGNASLREPGAATVRIGTADLTGAHGRQGFTTGTGPEAPGGLKTIAGGAEAPNTGSLEGAGGLPGSVTVTEMPADDGEASARGSDTARHDPAKTAGPFGNLAPATTQHIPSDASTESLSSSAAAQLLEEERLRADALRRQQEEEEARARQQQEERERLEREERERREAEERERREAEERDRQERERREAEERTRLEAEERQRQAEELRQAEEARRRAGAEQQQQVITPTPPSRLPLILGGALVLLVLLGGLGVGGYFVLRKLGASNTNGTTNANQTVNRNASANSNRAANSNNAANANTANANSTPGGVQTGADLVSLPGGTIQVGRSDVPQITDELRATRAGYLLWVYSQWPAHTATVGAFSIDRTEVTNAEYAEFVQKTGHSAPPGSEWAGDKPAPGMERMPVVNVSFDDAKEFAAWRSKRDGVTYRLPTEEEWEYAARGGDSTRVFPWGAEWVQGYANLAGAGAAPVGSFPLGRTPQGLDDMIGNVWEWTASEASMYKGNDRTALAPTDRGKMVVRGGSFKSRADGDEPVTVTARRWFAREFRDPVLGFRLVRDGS
ncbi:MAG TPA: bifunctional serine/threonine-protein kinase/formylglycine-generating enzyme family protein [Pyrinomonadaceae bacterium]|nr:bifunctional serine/threonine-protein kinase/formylglycine-generating enzyme family protein [Pyrinomonadaceae bacterium]